jgi:hypothetical protein
MLGWRDSRATERPFPVMRPERPAGRARNKTRARERNNSLSFLYEQRKQSTLPLKAFSNREPLRAMLHDENRLC